MTVNREPTADELNGVKQDTVQWPAKAHRVTLIDSDGNEIDSIELAAFTDNLDGVQAGVVASALFGRISDTLLKPVKLDASTQDLQIVEHEHAEIHSGDHYYVCGFESLGNGAILNIVGTMASTTKWSYFTFIVSGILGVTFEIFEDATLNATPGGTPITPLNNNRNSGNTSGNTILQDPTITTDGNLIYSQSIGAGRDGGVIDRKRELVFKQGSTYIIRITNQSANVNAVNFCGEWYEHTDKN